MAHLSDLLDWLSPWAKRLVPGPRNPGQETNTLDDIPVQEQGPRCISPALSYYAPGIVLLPSPPPSFATSRPVPGYLEQPFSANETRPITREHTKASVGNGNLKDPPGYACCLPISRRHERLRLFHSPSFRATTSIVLLIKMSSSFDILNGPKPSNSDVCGIEVRRTSTEQCANHLFLAFQHLDGSYTVASITKNRDAIEWVRSVELNPPELLCPSECTTFSVRYQCTGLQDLATSMYILESDFMVPESDPCLCAQWVDTVIWNYRSRGYIPIY